MSCALSFLKLRAATGGAWGAAGRQSVSLSPKFARYLWITYDLLRDVQVFWPFSSAWYLSWFLLDLMIKGVVVDFFMVEGKRPSDFNSGLISDPQHCRYHSRNKSESVSQGVKIPKIHK